MFGSLHIEMAALKSIGTLLQSSGWTSAIVETDIASSGTAESFLSASSVTRTRKAHQITASCLYKVLKDEYEYYCNEAGTIAGTILSFEDWYQKRLKESPQFHFWHLVLSINVTILSWLEHSKMQILLCTVKRSVHWYLSSLPTTILIMHGGFLFILETCYP